MIQGSIRSCRLCFLAIVVLAVASCSMAPHRYEPLADSEVTQRAITQQKGTFTVRASVPGKDEAEAIFGIPVYDRGIQPVWLQITNHADHRARVILSSIDREYFPPNEVAYIHRKQFSKQGWSDLEAYLHANALPRQIGPGDTSSGWVFTHASTGSKAFNLDIYGVDETPSYEQFTFFIEVPGFVPDHRSVDFQELYRAGDIRDVDSTALKALLAEIPCCTRNRDGSAHGRPVQIFIVSEGLALLRALLRAGWNETSYARDEDYLAGADYFYGRPPDGIFRKGRDQKSERAELALWLAPVRVDGQPLWVGQFKTAIGRRYAIGERFLGVTLDPDTTEGRDYMLQDLWYAQALKHWAWSKTGHAVSQDQPEQDLHGNPWFAADAYRAVIWVSGDPISMDKATPLEWGRHEAYTGERP